MIEVLKQALEALELEDLACRYEKEQTPEHIAKAIASLQQAIAELESQEPAGVVNVGDGGNWYFLPLVPTSELPEGTKFYTHPPQRTWQGLTDEEIEQLELTSATSTDIREIQAKLKEKNGFAEEKNT